MGGEQVRFRVRVGVALKRLARVLSAIGSRYVLGLIGVPWFIAVLVVILWIWGAHPVVFTTADEATNRLAASLVLHGQRPFLQQLFPDPENLVHLRPWRSLGDGAVPILPPLTFYLQGHLSRLGEVGYILIAALPATAAAAFAAGTARLLPEGRRWLAFFAPMLGFPALYWLMRPWMNMSLLLGFLCWALFAWAHWHVGGGDRWLAAALLCVGVAAAVRPDYAAFLLAVALLVSLAAQPERWKSIGSFTVLAGAGALGVNLILNALVIGDAWRGGYQLVLEAEPDPPRSRLLQIATLLLAPAGLPSWNEAVIWVERYWIGMGPVWLLLVGQVALLPLLKAQEKRRLPALVGALFVVLCLFVTRMYAGYKGATEPVGLVNHSIPRYWAPIYLFAALPPLLYLGRCKRRPVFVLGSVLTVTLALLGADELYRRQPTSFLYLERFAQTKTRWLESAARWVPTDAIIYSTNEDKIAWSRWRVAVIRAPDATATSIERAVASGRPVFILARGFPRGHRELARALKAANLMVERVRRRPELHRVYVPAPES